MCQKGDDVEGKIKKHRKGMEKMQDVRIRSACKEDLPALLNLWQQVFGDDQGYIELYFKHFFCEEESKVLLFRGSIVSAVYMPLLGKLVIPGEREEVICPSIYAFGTLPEYRGYGFGGKLLEAALKKIRGNTDAVGVICPAEESLFGYYKGFGYRDFFSVREFVYEGDELSDFVQKLKKNVDLRKRRGTNFGDLPNHMGIALRTANPEEYREIREKLLRRMNVPFISFDGRALSHQRDISQLYGGGLFVFGDSNPLGCCCVERGEEGEVLIKEILVEESALLDAVVAVREAFTGKRYSFRMPVMMGESMLAALENQYQERRFGMILGKEKVESFAGYYGFAFD